MRLPSRRAQVIAGTAASCAAIAAVFIGLAGAASAASAAPRPHDSVVLVNCAGKAQVEPSQFILTCADDGDYLAGLHWVSWKGVAFGSGTEHISDCYPYCAARTARFYSYPVLITLWRAKSAHGNVRYFSRLTEIRTGSLKLPHNRDLAQTQTWDLVPSGA